MKKTYKIAITAIDNNILTIYKNYIIKFLEKKNCNFSLNILPIKKKKITLLKSPHVNKKAKESFQLKKYRMLINIKISFIEKPLVYWLIYNKPKSLQIKVIL
jgi:small subunit ribosomal protein S10